MAVRERFGECEIRRESFSLLRRSRPVKIEPKVFDVLLYLVDRRDRVVTKHELLDALWPGEAVSDSVLPRCIAAARRAVGDTRARQRVLQTVHGRGYRFVEEVREEESRGSSSEPTAAPHEARTDFVGRSDALARLEVARASAAGGEGNLALLVGEPGIGKTRLTEELVARAQAAGAEVRVGHCFEGEGAPAYWPWIQVLREAVAETEDAVLAKQLSSGAADLSALVPEIATRLGVAPSTGPEGEQARFRLFDAASRFLAARSVERPLVVVLDDLHWGDASSLGLLRFLARQIGSQRVWLVATYRDVDVRRGHPLADLLGALAREVRCERVALSGLDAAEISDFVLAHTGSRCADAVAQRLLAMTDGNPFFLRETVELLAEQAARGEQQEIADLEPSALDHLVLPQGVRDAIGRRLDALSEECNQMLRAAAVIGREFPAVVLASILQGPEDADNAEAGESLLELIGEALDAGALVEHSRSHYAFAHALTRQTLYEELRVPQRIALHRRAGEALESCLGTARESHLAELAHHAFEAAPGGDVARAVGLAVEAAEFAHRQHAYEEAVEQYARALEALELAVPPDLHRRCELSLALGEERFTAGQRALAQDQLHEAANQARRLGRADILARCAIAIRGFGEFGSRPAPRDEALIAEALEALPEDDYALRASLLSRRAGGAMVPMATRREYAEKAMALAVLSGDDIALRDALSARWWASLGPDRLEERHRIAQEMFALAEKTGDPQIMLLSHESEIGACLVEGDRAGVERHLECYETLAAELRQPIFIYIGMMMRASWLMNCGRFKEFAEIREHGLEYARDRVAFAELGALGQHHWALIMQGDSDGQRRSAAELEPYLVDYFSSAAIYGIFRATIRYASDRDVGAIRKQIEGLDFGAIDRDEHWLLAMGALSDLAWAIDDRDLMEWLYETLTPYRELMGVHDLLRASTGSIHACLGELAQGLGRYDAAIDHYVRGEAKELATGSEPAALDSKSGRCRTLLLRGDPGDLALATTLLEEIRVGRSTVSGGQTTRELPALEELMREALERQEAE